MARGLPTGGQGSKVYVLCAEPKEHKHFRPGARPGGFGYPARRIGDRGDRETVYVPNVYVPFSAPSRFFFRFCGTGTPHKKTKINSVQNGRKVKGEAQKSPLFWQVFRV